MAIVRITSDGYGQVELNQVAFRRDGRIEAQCKLKEYAAIGGTDGFDSAHVCENGMLLCLDSTARLVKKPSAATDKVLLNFSSEHMYDERTPGLKNFCLVPGTFLPRLGYLATGDKFTTNCIEYDDAVYANEAAFWTAVDACGATPMYGCPSVEGPISVSTSSTNAVVKVVKKTTMPDGQQAIQFIAL